MKYFIGCYDFVVIEFYCIFVEVIEWLGIWNKVIKSKVWVYGIELN